MAANENDKEELQKQIAALRKEQAKKEDELRDAAKAEQRVSEPCISIPPMTGGIRCVGHLLSEDIHLRY